MDKRKEENLRVKKSITAALFSLVQEKQLADIHITEIIRKAGVARASFYRNYSSKEDIVVTLIRDILQEYREQIRYEDGNFYTYHNLLLSFQFFQKYRDYILNLCRSGFSTALLEELNLFHENIEGTMPASSIQRYELYVYIGALFNTALVWLAEEQRISAEEITTFFQETVCRMMNAKCKMQNKGIPFGDE